MKESANALQSSFRNSALDTLCEGISIQVGDDALSARRNFTAFCEFVMEDEQQIRWKQPDLHKQWDAIINKHRMVEILAPIEHAKTTQVTIARPLYELGRNPNLRFKIVSSSDEMAKEKLKLVKEYITDHPRYRAVFPWVKPDPKQRWESNVIFVKRTIFSKDPSIEARGVLSSTEGGRCEWLIGDDVCDFKNTIDEPARMPKVINAWNGVWLNRLADGGRAVYIGTHWHNLDLTAHLETNPEFRTYKFAIDKDYTPQWEAKWNSERLRQRARTIGTRMFNQKFRLIAISDEDKLFTPEIIKAIKRYDIGVEDIPRIYDGKLYYFGGMDINQSTNATSPRGCIFTIAVNSEDLIIPIRAHYGNWKATDQARQLIHEYESHKHQLIEVENNNYQGSLLTWMAEMPSAPRSLPLEGFTTGKNKADELMGLPGIAAEMERGGWVVPLKGHDVACTCGICQWLIELENYPLDFTDGVMASWFAREAARKGGGIVTDSIKSEPDKNSGQVEQDWYNTRKRQSSI